MNIRYLGYSNELGEAFRPILPYLVIPSYIIAVGYMIYDSYIKAKKAKNKVSIYRYNNMAIISNNNNT